MDSTPPDRSNEPVRKARSISSRGRPVYGTPKAIAASAIESTRRKKPRLDSPSTNRETEAGSRTASNLYAEMADNPRTKEIMFYGGLFEDHRVAQGKLDRFEDEERQRISNTALLTARSEQSDQALKRVREELKARENEDRELKETLAKDAEHGKESVGKRAELIESVEKCKDNIRTHIDLENLLPRDPPAIS